MIRTAAPESVHGDFWRAMEACCHASGTGSTRGVSGHRSLSPRTGKMYPAATGGISVDWESAWSADLTSVGVSAEVEVVAEGCGLPIGLRGVREKQCDVAYRDTLPCLLEIVGFEEVRVIDAADPKSFLIPFNGLRFIQ